MITHSQGAVEYQESGDGQTIVFVPGSFSAGSSWRNISTPLSERYRTITTNSSAWVALCMGISRSPKLISMTLLEPTAFNLLDLSGESALNQEVRAMTDRYMAEWENGNQWAVRHVNTSAQLNSIEVQEARASKDAENFCHSTTESEAGTGPTHSCGAAG